MTFYEKVLKEYKSNDETFICRGSEKFRKAWYYKAKREKIVEHAKLFLNEIRKPELLRYFNYRGNALFTLFNTKVRINFLEWCIKNNLDL